MSQRGLAHSSVCNGRTVDLLEFEPVALLHEIERLQLGEERGIEVHGQEVVVVLHVLCREGIRRVIRRCSFQL